MITLASPLTPVILRLLGLRRTAIVVAAVLLTWITIQASLTWLIQASNTVALLTVFAVELAALIASDGPRRGLRLVTWKGLLMAASWLVVAVTVGLDNDPGNAGVHVSRYLIALAIAAGPARWPRPRHAGCCCCSRSRCRRSSSSSGRTRRQSW